MKSGIGRQSVVARPVCLDGRYPLVVLVMLATAIPIDLRPLGSMSIGFDVEVLDVVVNIGAYAAIGLVLGEMRVGRAILLGAALSIAAEACQLIMRHRTPSAVDVAMNVVGMALGRMLGLRLGIRAMILPIGRGLATIAGFAALGLILWLWYVSGVPVNPRGFSSPGQLEAHWSFDETDGRRVTDTSGNNIGATLVGQARRVPGILGNGVRLDGKHDWVAIDRASELRLAGSLTLCAWIRPVAYPADDAAVVSSLSRQGHGGFQLDATADRGPRAIGFKMADECGVIMARYGKTPLTLDAWHHIAGVYRVESGTIDVYLNGKPDNGLRVGMESRRRWTSRTPVFVGRRSVPSGFRFNGFIDDVHIYSSALSETEIASVMRGFEFRPSSSANPPSAQSRSNDPVDSPCRPSEDEDALFPGVAGLLGLLGMMTIAGFRPGISVIPSAVISAGMGCLLLAGLAAPLPSFNTWLIPLCSLAGGLTFLVGRTAGTNGYFHSQVMSGANARLGK